MLTRDDELCEPKKAEEETEEIENTTEIRPVRKNLSDSSRTRPTRSSKVERPANKIPAKRTLLHVRSQDLTDVKTQI